MKKTLAIIPVVSSFYLDRLLPALDKSIDLDIAIIKSKKFEFSPVVQTILENMKNDCYIQNNTGGRLNYSESINDGAKFANDQTEYLIVMNQDVIPTSNAINELIQGLQLNQSFGIIGPCEQVFQNDELTDLTFHWIDEINGWDFTRSKGLFAVDGVSGFFMAILKDTFIKVGGFDSDLCNQKEDIDFCRRVRKSGKSVGINTLIKVFHVQGSSIQDMVEDPNWTGFKNVALPKYSLPNQIKIHVLGLAHVRTNSDFSYCAFTTLTINFCKMMKSLGYYVIFYGTAGSDVECDEFVEVLSDHEFLETYSCNLDTDAQYKFNYDDGSAWNIFATNANCELRTRIGKTKEIVIVNGGGYHAFVKTIENAIPVDAYIGHKACVFKYKIFGCKTWRAFVYGQNDTNLCNENYPPFYWRDAVIHHFLDWDEYIDYHPIEDSLRTTQQFVLFVGRLNQDKGIFDAVRLCHEQGLKLKVAGPNHPDTKLQFTDFFDVHNDIEYLGTVDATTRKDLMNKALFTLCPTYYNEPFGLVGIESLACGTPVISTDWGGFSEFVINGKTGFRFSYFQDMQKLIKKVIRLDRGYLRKFIKMNYTIDAVRKFYDNYLKRVLIAENTSTNPFYDSVQIEPIFQDIIFPMNKIEFNPFQKDSIAGQFHKNMVSEIVPIKQGSKKS